MTREDAIEILDNEKPHCGEKVIYTEGERCGAYEMAIAALRDQNVTDTNVPTNADHIRSMTDEELAVEIMCPYHIEPEMCNRTDTCVACCLEWLKQPYREEV